MKTLKPIFLFLLVSGLTEAREPSEKYRVIFNSDGHAVAKDAKSDLKQWIKNLFGPLADSHVDALFWCDGAGGNTANYDSKVLERTGARAGKPRTYIDRWIDEGNDPPKVVVREARRRKLDVFYSFRINDVHDSFMPDEKPTFKIKNPHWLIGKKQYGNVSSFPTALNFAIPEVRELKFRVIEELFHKYEFDGLEIDFLRSAPYFLPGMEAKNAPLLTALLKRVREHLDQRSKSCGRPIRLAVRVNESLRACRLNGFDVPEWIQQRLVDYISLGSGVMDIEVAEFKNLAAPHGIHVYACLYGWPSKYNPIPAELATGLALNYWSQGADGIYLFNWFPHTKNNSENTGAYMAGLLKQLGSPAALRARPGVMFAADRGRPQRPYQYNWLHCVLPEALPEGRPLQATIRVGSKLNSKVTVEMQVDNLQIDDLVELSLNGNPLKGLKRVQTNRLSTTMDAASLRIGVNEAVIRLAKRSGMSAKPRVVSALELHAVRPLPIRVKPGLFDQSKRPALGLPPLPGEHKLLYRATQDGYKFCHHSNLAVFKDRLYAMWSNGKVMEDANGQRILGCSTADGVNWTEPAVMARDPDGTDGPRAAVAAGFHVYDGAMTVFYTSIMDGQPIHPLNTLHAITTRDGRTWSKPREIATGFFIDGPRRLPTGRLLLNGQTADRQPQLLYSENPTGLTGWKRAIIPPEKIFSFPEPTWFRRADGTVVMLFRTRSGHFHLYASTSRDDGQSWSTPVETNFPDATARSFAGNLPNGIAYVLNNPATEPSATHPTIANRIPLTLALSADGRTFDRAYTVRAAPTAMRFKGKNKVSGWQYPSAVTWRGWLYIAYSINKEDIGVTRIRHNQLAPGSRE